MNIREYINKKADVIFIAIAGLTVAVFIVTAWQALDEVRQTFIAVNNVDNAPNVDNIIYNNQEDDIAPSTKIKWRCLVKDETAEYEKHKKKKEVSTATIFVKDKKSGEKKYSFEIELPMPGHYHPIELHKCSIYTTRSFNYDYIKKQALDDYRFELWQYDYNGKGKFLIFLSGPISGSNFGADFRVDPLERYLVLERGYLYKDDYALVIKDLETKEDVFVLLHSELLKKDLKLPGIFDFREWTKDGRYFWGEISAGAVVPGFFRIDSETWEYELFADVPEWIGGGDQLNVETGWVTYHTDMVWTGVHQMTEEIKQERREQGIGTTLYIYNLFTKEKRFIYKTEEPIWFTKPAWLSDTELEYELPNGEKRIYIVK